MSFSTSGFKKTAWKPSTVKPVRLAAQKDALMKPIQICSILWVSIVSMLSLAACNTPPEGPTIPGVGLLVNSSAGPAKVIVTISPLVFTARTAGTGDGSVEFFDGTTSIGTVATGIARPVVTGGFDFTLSHFLTRDDKGDRAYTVVFSGKDSTGRTLHVTSEPVAASVQIP